VLGGTCYLAKPGGGVLISLSEESALQSALAHLVADTRIYVLALEGYADELRAVAGSNTYAAAAAATIEALLNPDRQIGLRHLNDQATEALKRA
jgi:hypothetical protein